MKTQATKLSTYLNSTKLSTYVNNMFATCDDMETALTQAANIAGGADNAAAVHTAVHVVLNTAIKLHQADMAKANAPLIELIDARVAAAVEQLRSDIEVQVETAVEDFDHASVIASWLEDNFDLENALSGLSVRINFD